MNTPQHTSLLFINDYKVLMKLGDGGQAEVFLVERQKVLSAAKVFKSAAAMQKETRVLSRLSSPRIIKLEQLFDEATISNRDGTTSIKAVAVLQLAPRGDLYDMIQENRKKSRIPVPICRALFLDMMQALTESHYKGFAHRDIKPENFVFDQSFNLKMTDFGMAISLEGPNGDGRLYSRIGTAQYWAPEIFTQAYQGKPSDIFSLGMMLFIILYNIPPFRSAKPNDEFYKYFENGRIQENHEFWRRFTKGRLNVDPNLMELFRKIFQRNPADRPTLQEIKADPWLTEGPIATAEQVHSHFSYKYEGMLERDATRRALFELTQNKQEMF